MNDAYKKTGSIWHDLKPPQPESRVNVRALRIVADRFEAVRQPAEHR